MMMYEFDFTDRKQWEQDKIMSMKPCVDKLVSYLESKGISFIDKDENLENVIFYNDNKTVKMAYHMFYRFSGLCKIQKETKKGKNTITEWITVTDDMFINTYMKSIIEYHFGI